MNRLTYTAEKFNMNNFVDNITYFQICLLGTIKWSNSPIFSVNYAHSITLQVPQYDCMLISISNPKIDQIKVLSNVSFIPFFDVGFLSLLAMKLQ